MHSASLSVLALTNNKIRASTVSPVFLKVSASQFPFDKSHVEVTWIFMECFEMLVIVLLGFCAFDGKGNNENPISLLCGLGKLA